MDAYGYGEVTRLLPPNWHDGREYCPVLYRPTPTKVIPAFVRDLHSFAVKSPSELSQQISQRNIALLRRRIGAAGDLDRKRVLKCYGYRFGDNPYMIVALNDREPLSNLVTQSDLNVVERLKLLHEAGKAIQYLHSRRPPIVHGAVHPRHILIARPDSAVLSDFGLANVWRLRERDTSPDNSKLWDWLTPRQRVGYTAPEYILDDTAEMLPPGDIYAFGSVILAVLSNRDPHSGMVLWSAQAIAATVDGAPPDPKDHPNLPADDSLWPLLQRMWSLSPTDRPTIDEVMEHLDKELKTRSEQAHSEVTLGGVDEGSAGNSGDAAAS